MLDHEEDDAGNVPDSQFNKFLVIAVVSTSSAIVIIALGILIFRIAFPTILSHPWDMPPENSRRRKREKEMTVAFAGSFNPPHWGHLVMIRYLAERYGRVICYIGVNPNKQYDVTPQTRAQILREMLIIGSSNSNNDDGMMKRSCKNVEVEVVEGYIWRYAKERNASLFFRGIRTWSADGPEERHLQILNSWGPLLLGPVWPLKTVFLEGDPRYRDVSSTVVRRLCAEMKKERGGGGGGEGGQQQQQQRTQLSTNNNIDDRLSRLIPDSVLKAVVEAYGQ